MDQAYWLQRERESITHARAATLPDVQLIHYELARSYSIKAADAGREPLLRRRPKLKRYIAEQLTTAFQVIRTPAA
jgi:hypothetical protein